jgi:hypothetical protein
VIEKGSPTKFDQTKMTLAMANNNFCEAVDEREKSADEDGKVSLVRGRGPRYYGCGWYDVARHFIGHVGPQTRTESYYFLFSKETKTKSKKTSL